MSLNNSDFMIMDGNLNWFDGVDTYGDSFFGAAENNGLIKPENNNGSLYFSDFGVAPPAPSLSVPSLSVSSSSLLAYQGLGGDSDNTPDSSSMEMDEHSSEHEEQSSPKSKAAQKRPTVSLKARRHVEQSAPKARGQTEKVDKCVTSLCQ